MRIAIIGAGLTGLIAARKLADAGLSPVIFDKGRGVGGRLATRRADGGLQFDHGAQYLTASSPGFIAFLHELQTAGTAAPWHVDGAEKIVGLPGMTGIAKHLAQGLDIRQGVEVPALTRTAAGWHIADTTFDRVICTTPAPQAAALLGPAHPLHAPLQSVEMTPNLTLMLALPDTEPTPFITRSDPNDDIAWLALNSDKPGRRHTACWVAQASTEWSRAHLERDKSEIAAAMLPLVAERLGADLESALYVSAHRWRYAKAAKPFGQPYLSADDTLFVGGDWALSSRADGAFDSGNAMAEAVLATR